MTSQAVLNKIKRAKNKTKLVLRDIKLDELPDEIGELTQLTELDLMDNRLRVIPSWIGQLTNLKKLVLENNKLESLPAEFGRLQALENLDLGRNHFTELPQSVTECSRLKRINLTYTNLTALPPAIGRLVNLESLVLWGLKIQALPAEFFTLPNLKDLYFSRCPGIGQLLGSIGNLPKLDRIHLEECQLTEIPVGLLNKKKMDVVSFTRNDISQIPAAMVENDWNTVFFWTNNISLNSIPHNFADFKIKTLHVDGNPIERVKLSADFPKPPNLELKGLKHKISKQGFLTDIRATVTDTTPDGLAAIQTKYLKKLNTPLKKWRGADDMILEITEFQTIFLQTLFDKKIAKLRKAARDDIKDFYGDPDRNVQVDIHEIELPNPPRSQWGITFNDRTFAGPVVVFELNGWDVEQMTLVG